MKTKHYFLTFILVIVAIAGVVYFASRDSEQNNITDKKMRVSASFYPVYFFASQIAGDKATVVNVTPAGGEPHDYELTARDIAGITNSKLLILNGGGLEPWAEDIIQNLDSEAVVLVAGEGLATEYMKEDGEEIIDPHVWLSPPLAKQMVDSIERGFLAADTDNGAHYQENARLLREKLDELDQEFRTGLSICAKNDIITSHTAFGYLASTYGFNQVPITGISPDAEPSPQQLADIAKFAKENDVKIIFFESLVSPELSETIAQEVGATTLVLDPLEGLTEADIAQGEDYFLVMRRNLSNLQIALECQR